MHAGNNDAIFFCRGSVLNAFIVCSDYVKLRHGIEVRENGEMTSFWISRVPSFVRTVISDKGGVDRCIRCLSNPQLSLMHVQCSGSRVDFTWPIVREASQHGFMVEVTVGSDFERTINIIIRRHHEAILPVNVPTSMLSQMTIGDSGDIAMST